jgi:hypothetical protein
MILIQCLFSGCVNGFYKNLPFLKGGTPFANGWHEFPPATGTRRSQVGDFQGNCYLPTTRYDALPCLATSRWERFDWLGWFDTALTQNPALTQL